MAARLLLADAAPRADVVGARVTRAVGVVAGGSEEERLRSTVVGVLSRDVLLWAESGAAAAPARPPRRVPRRGALDIICVQLVGIV